MADSCWLAPWRSTSRILPWCSGHPLRFASCQTGTVIGVRSSGVPLTLGYRFDLVPSEGCSTGLRRMRAPASLPRLPEQWSASASIVARSPCFCWLTCCRFGSPTLRLRLLDWCSVSYRPDLMVPLSSHRRNTRAKVLAAGIPSDEFGWLHPASKCVPVCSDGITGGRQTREITVAWRVCKVN